jgi:hypothetical protein
MTKWIFKLKDQTIALLVFLLFLSGSLIISQGFKVILVIFGAALVAPLLFKFLFNPMIKIIGSLRKKYYED